MALKRQRADDYSSSVPTAGYGLEPFGQESIHKLVKDGNPNFTRGAFGEIAIALERRRDNADTYRFVAVKTIEQAISSPGGGFQSFGSQKQSSKLSREVFNELCALIHLNPHPNIVTLVAWYPSTSSFVSSTSLALAFSYAPVDLHLTLEWRRRACLPPLSFEVVKTIAHDLMSALRHCHELGVLHRDVKPGNLLVKQSGVIQLCDFGLAKPFLDEHSCPISTLPAPASGETGTKGLCTLFYRPPEVLLGGPANHSAIDMYSAGVTLAELIGGKPLMEGSNVMEQLSLVFSQLGTPDDTRWPSARLLPDYGKLEFAPKDPQPWSVRLPLATECRELPEFLDRLVALDPSRRMSAIEAMQHPVLAPGDDNKDSFDSFARPTLRSRLARQLIPVDLQIPPLLAPEDTATMARIAVNMATKRRSLLSKTGASWAGSELPPTTTLQEAINAC